MKYLGLGLGLLSLSNGAFGGVKPCWENAETHYLTISAAKAALPADARAISESEIVRRWSAYLASSSLTLRQWLTAELELRGWSPSKLREVTRLSDQEWTTVEGLIAPSQTYDEADVSLSLELRLILAFIKNPA